MATAPVKSQPLHNFSLPLLRWGHKNQMNTNHRYRRPSETTTAREDSPLPPAEHHRSSPSEKDSDGGGGGFQNESESVNRKLAVGSQPNRFSFASCSLQKQQSASLEREGGDGEKEKGCDEVGAEESLAKPWNLRPRKTVAKSSTIAAEIGRISNNGEFPETAPSENLPKSMRLRGFVEGQGMEKKQQKEGKRKFYIALSREEIEEDVYAMTGSKPARRPKKRPKTIQKQLDNVFPGLYLVGITADSYHRVLDGPR